MKKDVSVCVTGMSVCMRNLSMCVCVCLYMYLCMFFAKSVGKLLFACVCVSECRCSALLSNRTATQHNNGTGVRKVAC